MQDKELYSQLLGVNEPWKVSDVNIDFAGLKVDILNIYPKKQGGMFQAQSEFKRLAVSDEVVVR